LHLRVIEDKGKANFSVEGGQPVGSQVSDIQNVDPYQMNMNGAGGGI